ncbi:MAG: membrane protein insertion efficiency factor YidD [Treponema sp.]|jgi:putative component of membrane protein insertase Oxa1/YidC/SpoIIIJ protein YidD|nr:membrane protein insertion efficiency factor YidD [Treponema sp.]
MAGVKRRLFFKNDSACPARTFDVPAEAEQTEAREYVCGRVINKPDTDIKKAVKYLSVFLLTSQASAVFLCLLLKRIFFYFYFPPPFFLYLCVFIFCFLTGLGVCLKKAIIGAVKLYQHYAPEKTRRKCLFKPTCSEYMILAIEKYGALKGVYKGLHRLFVKCKGHYYSVDYP